MRKPGRRRQQGYSQNGGSACRTSSDRARCNLQSPVRLWYGRRRHGGPRHQAGRNRSRHCRRRRIDEPCSICHGQINEAFASQALACLRKLGVDDDAPHVNPNGGAIALGHPLGMSGARLIMTAVHQLQRSNGRRALATMCVGVGQGVALAVERI